MSSILVAPSVLKGKINIIPSKSLLHRAVICSALADGESIIDNIILSDDILATLKAVNALGRAARSTEDNRIITGGAIYAPKDNVIDCFESGSTLRFLIPLAGVLGKNITFTGKGRLPNRPLNEFIDLLPKHGLKIEKLSENNLPLKVSGKLKSGIYEIRGDVSSQYITGLLMSLPLLEGDSQIKITTEFESKGYADITTDVMKHFGVFVEEKNNTYYIKGNQTYKPCNLTAEGDWSQSAFWLCAGALGSDITLCGLNQNSKQGDKEIINLLKHFGANIEISDNAVRVFGGDLSGIEIDARQIPDLVPILAVVGSLAKGETIIKNAARVRLKECDRLSATAQALRAVGADIEEFEDGLKIYGKKSLYGGTVSGYNDHRMPMSFAIAATRCEKPIKIEGVECINKSYPNFFDDFNLLGGVTNGL